MPEQRLFLPPTASGTATRTSRRGLLCGLFKQCDGTALPEAGVSEPGVIALSRRNAPGGPRVGPALSALKHLAFERCIEGLGERRVRCPPDCRSRSWTAREGHPSGYRGGHRPWGLTPWRPWSLPSLRIAGRPRGGATCAAARSAPRNLAALAVASFRPHGLSNAAAAFARAVAYASFALSAHQPQNLG